MLVRSSSAAVVLLLVGLLSGGVRAQTTAQPVCTPSQSAALTPCLSALFANFKLTLSSLPNYTAFLQLEENYFNQGGLTAFQTFCQWQQTFYTCLETNIGHNVRVCLNEDNFQKLTGLNQSDAYAYISDLYVHDYTCRAGYQIATANWACIRQIEQTQTAKIQACRDALNQGGFSCSKYSTFIGCMQDAFSNVCGNTQDLRTYICEVEKIGFEADTTSCDGQLPKC